MGTETPKPTEATIVIEGCEDWCNDPCNKFCNGKCSESNGPVTGVCEEFEPCKDLQGAGCVVYSKAKQGYYADSRDCRNFCFLTGDARVPSKFQQCPGGLVWDPSCENNDEKKTKGCCNWPEDTNTDHCKMV